MLAWLSRKKRAELPTPPSPGRDNGGGFGFDRPAENGANVHPPQIGKTPSEARLRIESLVSIAASNGSSISTEELLLLLRESEITSEESLRNFISEDDGLRESLSILHGEIAPRGRENLIGQRGGQRARTAARIDMAQRFVADLARLRPWVRLVGISGSTAYNGSKPKDDIDVFLVAGRRRLWITLLVAMVAAKAKRLRDRASPVFCFNLIIDEDECRQLFLSHPEPLFAREALELKVLLGGEYYQALLRDSGWMEGFFPRYYRSRLHSGAPRLAVGTDGGRAWDALDLAAYLGLGTYLALVNFMRNRKLARQGRRSAQFRTTVRRNSYSCESRKFDELLEQYRGMF